MKPAYETDYQKEYEKLYKDFAELQGDYLMAAERIKELEVSIDNLKSYYAHCCTCDYTDKGTRFLRITCPIHGK